MPSVDEYRSAGLYDPDDPRHAGRVELLDWLTGLGFSIPQIVRSAHADVLRGLAGDRRMVPGERHDRATALRRSGLPPDDFDAYSTAFGFVPISGAPDGEVGYTDDEIDAIATVGQLAAIFTPEEALGLIRVIGASLGRIADACVSMFLADVEERNLLAGSSELELAHIAYEATGLLDGLSERLDPILRRQMLQAVERTRRATIDDTDRIQYRYAVGFVDLVGFTTLSANLPPAELATFIGRFEGLAHDVAAANGARVVKLIGDEVMFVATEAPAACHAAHALIEAFAADLGDVVPRGGLAYGNVVLRGGDYYGPVVNLASRLVDQAVPLEVLATREVAEAAPSCDFEPSGRRMVKGFDEPISVVSLRR